jgi:Bacterial PH domain
MNEHDYEPIPGLPAPLPPGETILWQGSPNWEVLARRALRIQMVGMYFVVLIAWGISGNISAGTPAINMALSALRLSALAVVALALLALFAWLVARTTIYTITTRRVIMRFGIALPITIQIAYPMIDAAGLRVWPDGAGDIALALRPGQRIAYLVVWPHARPWKLTKAEPTLRGVPDAAPGGPNPRPGPCGVRLAACEARLRPGGSRYRQRHTDSRGGVTEHHDGSKSQTTPVSARYPDHRRHGCAAVDHDRGSRADHGRSQQCAHRGAGCRA